MESLFVALIETFAAKASPGKSTVEKIPKWHPRANFLARRSNECSGLNAAALILSVLVFKNKSPLLSDPVKPSLVADFVCRDNGYPPIRHPSYRWLSL